MYEVIPELTGIAGVSLVIAGVIYVIMIVLTFYTLYLNWKQSKVKDQMGELITLTREIRDTLKKKKISKK